MDSIEYVKLNGYDFAVPNNDKRFTKDSEGQWKFNQTYIVDLLKFKDSKWSSHILEGRLLFCIEAAFAFWKAKTINMWEEVAQASGNTVTDAMAQIASKYDQYSMCWLKLKESIEWTII